MKKKLLIGGLFAIVLTWKVSSLNIVGALVAFVAVGAVPGMSLTLSPSWVLGGAGFIGLLLMGWMIVIALKFFKRQTPEKLAVE